MQKRELFLHAQMGRLQLEQMIGAWATRHDANMRPMGRLVRRYKTEGESMHWHIGGLQKGTGTVEVTYQPSNGRLTVLVHDNRRGSWAGQAYKDLAREIAKRARPAS